MKKNILSLVAFMAFSLSAFANTVEVKDEVVEVKEEVVVVDCYAVAQATEFAVTLLIETFSDHEVTYEEGYYIFAAAYETCVATGNCPSCM